MLFSTAFLLLLMVKFLSMFGTEIENRLVCDSYATFSQVMEHQWCFFTLQIMFSSVLNFKGHFHIVTQYR